MRAVNLLPRDAERQRSTGGPAPLFVAAGGIAAVTAATVVLALSASGTVDSRRAEVGAAEAAIAALQRDGRSAIPPGALARERSARLAALFAALTSRVPFDRLLRELSYVLPQDAWLTGLTASAPADTGPAGSPTGGPTTSAPTGLQGVTMQGATYSHASVARVLARLSLLPTLTDVRLAASARVEPPADAGGDGKEAKPKGKTVVTFVIEALLTGDGS